MTTPRFAYRVFGLRLISDRELPELPIDPAASDEADVDIRWEEDLSAPSDPSLDAVADGSIIRIPGAAEYRVLGGRHVVVRPEPNAPSRNVRLFLLGSVMGLVLHQRGILPLHANAIEIDGRAVAFMGESGAGKSTLAAWFADCGHRIIADDVCAVTFDDDGLPRAQPGIPRLRLWRQSLEAAGKSLDGLHRSFVGQEGYDKWDVPMNEVRRCAEALVLTDIYVLARGDLLQIRRLGGLEAVEQLFVHTYRGAFVNKTKGVSSHLQQCLRLLKSVGMFELQRPWQLAVMDQHNAELLARIGNLD